MLTLIQLLPCFVVCINAEREINRKRERERGLITKTYTGQPVVSDRSDKPTNKQPFDVYFATVYVKTV